MPNLGVASSNDKMCGLYALALLGCLAAPVAASAEAPFDGVWSVTIQTRTGSCDATASYSLTVADGRISGPANVTGTISRSGYVRVSLGAAYANGQLEGRAGAGKWNGASAGVPCSGRWEASKQS